MGPAHETAVQDQAPHCGQGLNDKKCVWLGVSWGLDLAFLDAD